MDQARVSSLDPIFIGPYLVLARKGAHVPLLEPRSRKEKWVHLNRCKAFRKMTDCGAPILMKNHLAEDYFHPNYDELEECSETTGEEEQFNHMVEEDIGIEEEVRNYFAKAAKKKDGILWRTYSLGFDQMMKK